jgi:phage-related protein
MIPISHVNDAHSLSADGKVDLYELSPSVGSGTIRFKSGPTTSWLGRSYTGIGAEITGESQTAQGTAPQPGMIIGQTDIDLSAFKPLIWSGGLDNARIIRSRVLLDNMLNNRDIKETSIFRVKRVDGYTASQISLTLAVFSPTGPTTLPFRQYIPPDFPFVVL